MTMNLAILGIFAVPIAAIAWIRPMFAVTGFLAITVTNASAVLVHEHGLPPVAALLFPCLALLFLARTIVMKEKPAAIVALAFPCFAFLVLNTAQVPWVGDFEAALAFADDLAKNLIILLVLVGFLNTINRLRLAVRTVAMSLGVIASLTVFQYLTGDYENNILGFANAEILHIQGSSHGWRVSGPLPDPNFYAQLLVMAVPLTVHLAITERKWHVRVLSGFFTCTLFAAILLTYSRGALFALFVVTIAFIVTTRHRSLILAVTAGAWIAIFILTSSTFTARAISGLKTTLLLFGSGEISGDSAVIERASAMHAAFRMFVDHPLIGIGPAQFDWQYQSYALQYGLDPFAPPAPHSLYLRIAAEGGLLGLVVFASVIAMTFGLSRIAMLRFQTEGCQADVSMVRALMLSIVAYLATSLFLHDSFPRFFWTFMALLLATPAASGYSVANPGPKCEVQ